MRVSVTSVDQLRYYRDSESMDLAQLIDRLTSYAEPTEAMQLGSAIHAVLEEATPGLTLNEIERDGFRIRFACDASIALPEVRELKLERAYQIDGEEITVSGKVDGLQAGTISDHKVTQRFDPDRFIESMQWRAYLELSGCDRFVWNVFEVSHLQREEVWKVFGVHQLEQYRYPGLGQDWLEALTDYVRFARRYLAAA